MSGWGWRPERTEGVWRHGSKWMRPFAAAVPWITVGLLMLMLHFVSGRFTASEGVLFDLPDSAATDGENASLVVLVMQGERESTAFFEDSRYSLGDEVSCGSLGRVLAERLAKDELKTILVLADRRTSAGDLMRIAALAKSGGAQKVLFANRRQLR